jgi:hypothetical protein
VKWFHLKIIGLDYYEVFKWGEYVRASITVKQRRRLDDLFAMLAALALEGLMRLALRVLIEQEQFPKGVDRKMTLCIFLFIYHSRGEGLLRSLTLEYLFFDSTSRNESIHEAYASYSVNGCKDRRRRDLTHILFSDRHARHVPELAGLLRDSNLEIMSDGRSVTRGKRYLGQTISIDSRQ